MPNNCMKTLKVQTSEVTEIVTRKCNGQEKEAEAYTLLTVPHLVTCQSSFHFYSASFVVVIRIYLHLTKTLMDKNLAIMQTLLLVISACLSVPFPMIPLY